MAADDRKQLMDTILIDAILDEHNNQIALHHMFGDECYKDKADGLLFLLHTRYKKVVQVKRKDGGPL